MDSWADSEEFRRGWSRENVPCRKCCITSKKQLTLIIGLLLTGAFEIIRRLLVAWVDRFRSVDPLLLLLLYRRHWCVWCYWQSYDWRQANQVDQILEWQPPEVLTKYYALGMSGYDKLGCPGILPFSSSLSLFILGFFCFECWLQLENSKLIRCVLDNIGSPVIFSASNFSSRISDCGHQRMACVSFNYHFTAVVKFWNRGEGFIFAARAAIPVLAAKHFLKWTLGSIYLQHWPLRSSDSTLSDYFDAPSFNGFRVSTDRGRWNEIDGSWQCGFLFSFCFWSRQCGYVPTGERTWKAF